MTGSLLTTPFRKTVRDLRPAMAIWSVAIVLLMLVGVGSYHVVLGADAPDRARQLADFSRIVSSFGYLLGEIVPIDNVGGYLTLRILPSLPLVLGIWALLAGSGMIRGEEEQGILDMHLAGPVSRRALGVQKFAAFTAVCALLGVVTWAATLASGTVFGEPLGVGPAALAALNSVTLAWFWGAVALLIGQFVAARRVAAAITGGFMFASYLIDTNLSTRPAYKAIIGLLPHHYASLNKPLVPGR
ncbi:MAG TPA: ABC transporter permease subunit, partial [Chloroflexia bacterium]|nr:ABC transporter permease subunit [Chloroflexia bacterium]